MPTWRSRRRERRDQLSRRSAARRGSRTGLRATGDRLGQSTEHPGPVTFGPGPTMGAGAWWKAWNGTMPRRVARAAWYGPALRIAGCLLRPGDARLGSLGVARPALTGRRGSAVRLTMVLSLRVT